jgi:hypothetical protein
MAAAGPAQRAGGSAQNLAAGGVFRRDLQQSFPPAAGNPQPRAQHHPWHGDRCCAGRQQSPAVLLQGMLVKDASQLVIENLAGLGAISRIISHAPSMSDLAGRPGQGKRPPWTPCSPASRTAGRAFRRQPPPPQCAVMLGQEGVSAGGGEDNLADPGTDPRVAGKRVISTPISAISCWAPARPTPCGVPELGHRASPGLLRGSLVFVDEAAEDGSAAAVGSSVVVGVAHHRRSEARRTSGTPQGRARIGGPFRQPCGSQDVPTGMPAASRRRGTAGR